MRILLDECVPRPFRDALPGHNVRTVADMGWTGKKNGELLGLIVQAEFAAFITVDQNLRYQQNLRTSGIAIIVLRASRNRLANLLPLAGSVQDTLDGIAPGEIIEITE